jgi:hypothetical protein
MNYIITETQLKMLVDKTKTKGFSLEEQKKRKKMETVVYSDEGAPLEDYVGEYTFIDKKKGKVVGDVTEEGGKLKVSKDNLFFLLTRVNGDNFEGQTTANHDVDEEIPQACGNMPISMKATFLRNGLGQVCSVKGTAEGVCTILFAPIKKSRNMEATKNGVSCDAQPEQQPKTPVNPQQPETPGNTGTEQQPKTPVNPQQPETPGNTGTEQKPAGYRKPPKIVGMVTRV